MPKEEIVKAKQLLRDVTPLHSDCGRRCGAACCSPDEDGQGGMLLFPGEQDMYANLPQGFTITETEDGLLLCCDGFCERAYRPLSCMLFPLWIFEDDDGFVVRQDRRGYYVCPLSRKSIDALAPEFVKAVQEAAKILLQDEAIKQFLFETGRKADAFGMMPEGGKTNDLA